MSADNGIYVAIFGDGKIRVTHAQAFDSCWLPDTGAEDASAIVFFFGEALEFLDLDSARIYAYELETEIGYTEYGIQYGIRFNKSFSDYLEESPTIQNNDEPYEVFPLDYNDA
jgi:hypothetical protein